jgi:hypothetical protein
MRPNLHPFLVNGRFGDPALFVEMLHRRSALLSTSATSPPSAPATCCASATCSKGEEERMLLEIQAAFAS